MLLVPQAGWFSCLVVLSKLVLGMPSAFLRRLCRRVAHTESKGACPSQSTAAARRYSFTALSPDGTKSQAGSGRQRVREVMGLAARHGFDELHQQYLWDKLDLSKHYAESLSVLCLLLAYGALVPALLPLGALFYCAQYSGPSPPPLLAVSAPGSEGGASGEVQRVRFTRARS